MKRKCLFYDITFANWNYVSWIVCSTTFHHICLFFFVLCRDTDCPFLMALCQHCNAHCDAFQLGCHNNEGLGPKAGESRSLISIQSF